MRERKYDKEEIVSFFKKAILEKGYENVSVRDITNHFEMPVSSIYRYFSSKEEILDATLEPVLNQFNESYAESEEESFDYIDKMTMNDFFDTMKMPLDYLDILFRFKDEFKILLSDLKGTKYEGFLQKLVKKDTKSTYQCLKLMKEKGFQIKNLDENIIRIVTETDMNLYFSVIRYDFEYDYAKKVFLSLQNMQIAGYKAIFIGK